MCKLLYKINSYPLTHCYELSEKNIPPGIADRQTRHDEQQRIHPRLSVGGTQSSKTDGCWPMSALVASLDRCFVKHQPPCFMAYKPRTLIKSVPQSNLLLDFLPLPTRRHILLPFHSFPDTLVLHPARYLSSDNTSPLCRLFSSPRLPSSCHRTCPSCLLHSCLRPLRLLLRHPPPPSITPDLRPTMLCSSSSSPSSPS